MRRNHRLIASTCALLVAIGASVGAIGTVAATPVARLHGTRYVRFADLPSTAGPQTPFVGEPGGRDSESADMERGDRGERLYSDAVTRALKARPSRRTGVVTPTPVLSHNEKIGAAKSRAQAGSAASSGRSAGLAPRNAGASTSTFPPSTTFSAQVEGNVAPPDTTVAVSATRIVEAVNATMKVYDRAGTELSSVPLLNLMNGNPSSQSFADPKVVYDFMAKRWYVSGMLICTNGCTAMSIPDSIVLAVSPGDDPTAGTWAVYTLATDTTGLDDQPRMGWSTDKIMVSWDRYDSSRSFDREQMEVVDRADVLAGIANPAAMQIDFQSRRGLVPAVPQPGPLATVGTTGYAAWYDYGTFTDHADVVIIGGSPKGNPPVYYSGTNQPIASMHRPVGPPQPGQGNPALDGGDNRFLSDTLYNNQLLIAANDGCTPHGDTTTQTCSRILQIDLSAVTVQTDIDLATAGAGLAYPAVTPTCDGSGLVLSYSKSSISQYPTATMAVAPLPIGNGPVLEAAMAAGTGIYNQFFGGARNRWGDYSGISVDPYCEVWGAAEFGADKSGNWATQITGLTFVAPTVTAVKLDHGPPGFTVDISGTNFTPGSIVTFGSAVVPTIDWIDSTHLRVVAPQHAPGMVDVRVTNEIGTSSTTLADLYTFSALAYISAPGTNQIYRFDLGWGIFDVLASLSGAPHGLALTPDALRLYVSRPNANAVTPIDLRTDVAGASLNVGKAPLGLATSSDDLWAFAVSQAGDKVVRLAVANGAKKTLPAGMTPQHVAVTPDNRWAFVANAGTHDVRPVDLATLSSMAPIPIGSGYTPVDITASPDSTTVYVVSRSVVDPIGDAGLLSAIDVATKSVKWVYEVGADPRSVVADPTGAFVLESNHTDSTIDIVAAANGTLVATIPTPDSGPTGLAIDSTGTLVEVLSDTHGSLTELDLQYGWSFPVMLGASTSPQEIVVTKPYTPVCKGTVSTPTLSESPADLAAGQFALEVFDVRYCSPTGGNGAATLLTAVSKPVSCPPVDVPKTRALTLVPGDNPVFRGFTAPTCAGTYTVRVTLKQGSTVLGKASASFVVG